MTRLFALMLAVLLGLGLAVEVVSGPPGVRGHADGMAAAGRPGSAQFGE